MAISGVILVITVWQFVSISKGFLPPDVDSSQIFAYTRAEQGISFDSLKAHQDELNQIAERGSEPPGIFFDGGRRSRRANSGFIFVHLKDPSDRPKVPSAMMSRLIEK